MRVLLVGSVFPRSESDDQVPWLREVCRQVRDAGIEVEVLAPSFKGIKSHTIDGITVHRFRYGPAAWEMLTGEEGAPSKLRRNPLLKLLVVAYMWCGFWALIKLLCGARVNEQRREKRPTPCPLPKNAREKNDTRGVAPAPLSAQGTPKKYDLIEVHWPFPHAFIVLPAVWTGIPIIYHYHSAELKLAAQNKFSNSFFAWSLAWAKAHVANSSYTAGLIKKLNPKLNVEIIAYGSPLKFDSCRPASQPLAVHPDPSKGDSSALSRFNRGSAAIEEGGEAYKGLRPATQYPAAPYRARRKLLFVGRHIERKGITYLIDAIKLLPSDYTLTIIGDGDQTDTLKKQAKELIKQGRVVFTGRLSAEEITRAYKDHDVFVCPSIVDSKGDTEGLGVVLIEAIAAELPIVASDVGGIPDLIIDAQTGLLVGQKESLALAAAIQKIGNDETLAQKLIEGARAHAQKHFSWESVTQQTIALYGRFLIK